MTDKWGGRRGGAALPTQPETQYPSVPSLRVMCAVRGGCSFRMLSSSLAGWGLAVVQAWLGKLSVASRRAEVWEERALAL